MRPDIRAFYFLPRLASMALTIPWTVLVAVCVATGLFWARSRARQYRKVATELGFVYRGTTIPDSLDISKVSFWGSGDSVVDLITGTFKNVETAAFLIHHSGDMSYQQTCIAMQSKAALTELSNLWRASEIRAERTGEWVVMFRPRETVTPAKLAKFLDECRSLLQYFEDREG